MRIVGALIAMFIGAFIRAAGRRGGSDLMGGIDKDLFGGW